MSYSNPNISVLHCLSFSKMSYGKYESLVSYFCHTIVEYFWIISSAKWATYATILPTEWDACFQWTPSNPIGIGAPPLLDRVPFRPDGVSFLAQNSFLCDGALLRSWHRDISFFPLFEEGVLMSPRPFKSQDFLSQVD